MSGPPYIQGYQYHAGSVGIALGKAIAEHGVPNSFSFGELHRLYGAPPPMLAGRAARLHPSDVRGPIEARIGAITIEDGRIYIAAAEGSAAR